MLREILKGSYCFARRAGGHITQGLKWERHEGDVVQHAYCRCHLTLPWLLALIVRRAAPLLGLEMKGNPCQGSESTEQWRGASRLGMPGVIAVAAEAC